MLSFVGSPRTGERPNPRWLVAAVIFSSCQLAWAQEPPAQVAPSNGSLEDAARSQIALGLAKYEAGEFRPAAELFLEAYKSVPDANLLYNAARCYERIGENRKAIVRYQQFIEAPDSEEGGKARANAALQRLEQAEFLALRKGPTDNDNPTDSVDAANIDLGTCDCHSGLPWYLLGVGTLSVGGGIWSLVSGLERQREVTADPAFNDASTVHPLTYGQSKSLLESSERRIAWGSAGLGAGGALVATAIVWMLLDTVADAQDPRVRVDVHAGNEQGGLVVGGWF